MKEGKICCQANILIAESRKRLHPLEFLSNIDQFFILSPQIITDVSSKTRLEAPEIQAVPCANLNLKNLIANKEIAETGTHIHSLWSLLAYKLSFYSSFCDSYEVIKITSKTS